MEEIANFFNFATGQAEGPKIPENQMVISAPGLKFISKFDQFVSKCSCVCNNLLSIFFEGRISNLFKRRGYSSNRLNQLSVRMRTWDYAQTKSHYCGDHLGMRGRRHHLLVFPNHQLESLPFWRKWDRHEVREGSCVCRAPKHVSKPNVPLERLN